MTAARFALAICGRMLGVAVHLDSMVWVLVVVGNYVPALDIVRAYVKGAR